MADTCRGLGVEADRREGHPGCWVDPEGSRPRKIGALGLRIERGVSYHGIALNVTVDLAGFDLIDPCGMPDVESTSIARELGRADEPPSTEQRRDRRAAVRRRPGRPPGRSSLSRWRPGCSSFARTPSPAGGSPPSSTGRSTATASSSRRPRSTTPATARTAASRQATESASGRSRTTRSTSSGPRTRPVASSVTSPRSRSSRPGRRAAGGRSSPRRASTGPSRRSGARSPGRCSGPVATPWPRRRSPARPAYVQVVQNWGAQAGARTNHLCLDLYDLPQVPHRVAEEIGGAARFVIREGECPFCRLVRDEPKLGDRLVWEDAASVAFAPFASRSPFEVWIVPRRHAADFGEASDADVAASAEALRQVLGRLAGLDGPPHNLVLHTAPRRRADRRDVPLALGDPPPAARDRRARARHRAAGQPGLAGGGRRGAPAHRRRPRRGTLMASRHTRATAVVFGPCIQPVSLPSPRTAR